VVGSSNGLDRRHACAGLWFMVLAIAASAAAAEQPSESQILEALKNRRSRGPSVDPTRSTEEQNFIEALRKRETRSLARMPGIPSPTRTGASRS
jgi:hypothetical protein